MDENITWRGQLVTDMRREQLIEVIVELDQLVRITRTHNLQRSNKKKDGRESL